MVGVFGSLLGLGGGILIVPLLNLGFGVPIRDAVGISLVCVIMTSSASAAVYLERRVANLRLGATLELAAVSGALCGATVAFMVPERGLAALFAAMLVYAAASMARRRSPVEVADAGSALDEERVEVRPFPDSALASDGYRARHLGRGLIGGAFAGIVSSLLGVGGGIVTVPLMNVLMGVPLRAATGTSTLVMGVTAAGGAIVYLVRGGIDPLVAGPTAIGVFAGASIGARAAHRVDLRVLRLLFVVVMLYTATVMALRALAL